MMESNPKVKMYRELQLKMGLVREKYRGSDSEEEDDILDEMDLHWGELTPEEQNYLNTHKGPHYDFVVKWIRKDGGV